MELRFGARLGHTGTGDTGPYVRCRRTLSNMLEFMVWCHVDTTVTLTDCLNIGLVSPVLMPWSRPPECAALHWRDRR